MTLRRCYFMPLLRTGDLLFNAVVLQRRLVDRTTTHEALEAVRGTVGGLARDLFGHNVTEISTHLLGDSSHAERLLHEHTLFGVFRHALSGPVATSWAEDLKAGRHLSCLRSLGASPSDIGALSAPYLRSCRQCIEADRELQGFPTWKLTHQVAAIDRCPDHGAALDSESRPIGGSHARIWPLHLPGENLASCATPNSIPPSDGYAAYLRLWRRILTDELPWLKPSAWIQSMQEAVSNLGGIDAATREIENDLQRAWGAPIGHISAALFLGGNENAVYEELSLRSRPKDIARRMLIHGSLDRLGLKLVASTEGDQRELFLSAEREDRQPAMRNAGIEELLNLADQSGLPLASIRLAELDSGFAHVSQAIGINDLSLRRFAASLEISMLLRLMDSLQLSAESWVASEIARRSKPHQAKSLRATYVAME